MRHTLTFFAVLAGSAFADDPDPADPKVKPREVKIDKAPAGVKNLAPARFDSAADLAKVHGKAVADAVAKQLDFAKEYAVVFAWAGSGRDRMKMAVDGKKATFALERGLTRDLRGHFAVFALPKGFTYEAGR